MYKKSKQRVSIIVMLAMVGLSFAPFAMAQAAQNNNHQPRKDVHEKHQHRKETVGTTTPIVVPPVTIPPVATTTVPVATTTVPIATSTVPATSSSYGMSQTGTFQETGSPSESSNSSWWLNSGAYFTVANGAISTVQGSLAANNPWRAIYASANPEDTDNGAHPQNIFRLVTTSAWKNVSQQAYFTVNAYNASASSNRDGYNGFLFFNRYVDSQNLYYTGLRVDGTAVIKKKINGTYFTMDQQTVYPGTYNHDTNPNLIPTHTQIGLKSVITDTANGSVSIKLYVDKNHDGNWTLAASAIDDGSQYGGPAITAQAPAGIRTDFMDATFTGYTLTQL